MSNASAGDSGPYNFPAACFSNQAITTRLETSHEVAHAPRMTSPAEADVPAPARRDTDSAWAKVILGVVMFLLLVEFVLPGFVAAGFSRMELKESRVMKVSLAPAIWMSDHSPKIEEFYDWEYKVAGGN